MAAVVTTPATGADLGIAKDLTALEVRSGGMIVTLREISEGGLIVVATPAAGFDLVTNTQEQGATYRVTIRAKATG
jgi:hypothetical protein